MKQTAVEQLIEKMSLEDVCKYSNQLADAKEMEKEQIIDAYTHDRLMLKITPEQYYNENNEFEWGVFPNELGSGIQVKNRIKLKYVHQLQNLHFALTGEELTFKS